MENKYQLPKDKFGLHWELESDEWIQKIENATLSLSDMPELSISFPNSLTENRLIKGDNLPVLKLLQPEFLGKVDLIYIDPPYNTGFKQDQEGFSYHDKRKKDHHRYGHSAWLNFMYPRLEEARKLLAEDGLIFISIDENEFAHLKLLCDELFGERNFVNYLIWKKRSTGGQVKSGSIITQTEFVFIYAKDKTKAKLQKVENPSAGNIKWRDFRKSGGQWQQRYRPKQHYPFYYDEVTSQLSLEKFNDACVEIIPQDSKGEPGFWENGLDTARVRLANNELRAQRSKQGVYKILQLEEASSTQNAGNFLDIPSVQGSHEIKQFDLHFNNVKPLALLEFILELGSKPDALVLDFFAGSGSTAHAVMKMNKERMHQRKFIVCTNNEFNLFDDVTYPRLIRCIKGYTNIAGKTHIGYLESMKVKELKME